MGTVVTESSAGTVVEDLVSDRSVCLKVGLSILHVAQLISCWAVVLLHIMSYNYEVIVDMSVSIAFLVVGQHIVPGIANGIIYYHRFHRANVYKRQKAQEENKEAWICLRLTFTVLGLSPIGRYVETLMVTRRLVVLEREHMAESINEERSHRQLNPSVISGSAGGPASSHNPHNPISKPNSKGGSALHSSGLQSQGYKSRGQSMVSGVSGKSAGGQSTIGESSLRRVRRCRRQFRRCEHDGALMALVTGVCGAGPMVMLQMSLYLRRDQLAKEMKMSTSLSVAILVCCILCLLWLAAALSHFFPARHQQAESDFERGVGSVHRGAVALVFLAHLTQVAVRCIAVGLFTSQWTYWVLLILGLHMLISYFILLTYRCYMRPSFHDESASQKVKSLSGALVKDIFHAYASIFDFINANAGKTRARYLVFYAFYYAENVVMIVVWYLLLPTTAAAVWYRLTSLIVVILVFFLGFGLLQFYLCRCSSSPEGSSICGLCLSREKKLQRQQQYSERAESTIRDPVFGAPVAQVAVPFNHNKPPGSRLTAGSRTVSALEMPPASNIGNRPVAPSISMSYASLPLSAQPRPANQQPAGPGLVNVAFAPSHAHHAASLSSIPSAVEADHRDDDHPAEDYKSVSLNMSSDSDDSAPAPVFRAKQKHVSAASGRQASMTAMQEQAAHRPAAPLANYRNPSATAASRSTASVPSTHQPSSIQAPAGRNAAGRTQPPPANRGAAAASHAHPPPNRNVAAHTSNAPNRNVAQPHHYKPATRPTSLRPDSDI